jgi:hypothetical protein
MRSLPLLSAGFTEVALIARRFSRSAVLRMRDGVRGEVHSQLGGFRTNVSAACARTLRLRHSLSHAVDEPSRCGSGSVFLPSSRLVLMPDPFWTSAITA